MKIFSPKRKKFIAFVIALLVLVVFLNFGQKTIRDFVYSASFPAQKVLWQGGKEISGFLGQLISIRRSEKEIERLRAQNSGLLSELIYLRQIKEENDFLRKSLNLTQPLDLNLALTEVAGKDIGQDFITVSVKTSDILRKNMPVITNENFLVGKVSEVFPHFAKIALISHEGISFGAKLHGKDIEGVIKGENRGKMILDLVPQDKEVLEGDVLLTTGLEGIFPPGIPAGQVERVQKNDVEPFQRIEVKTFFDITKLQFLFVIK